MEKENNPSTSLRARKEVVLYSNCIETSAKDEFPARLGAIVKECTKLIQKHKPDAVALESLPMGFGDLLASSDAMICKPGYGSFAEAACSGTPVLYVNRADWPESPALIEWLQRHGLCREVSRNALEQGNFADALEEIRHAPRPKPVIPEGAGQVADWIAERLQR